MSVIIIDSDKPESIKMLIEALKPYFAKESLITEWVDESTARLILGGGVKKVSEKYLRKLREERQITFSQLSEREYRYLAPSIISYIKSKAA